MERLQKAIAKSGVCSRRKAESLILEGKVKVNGHIVDVLGSSVSDDDIIHVDNKIIKSESKVYLVLNKPRNTISSSMDDRGRKTVIDCVESGGKRLFPVGRLDFDTTGVILITNDGELSNKLLHPSNKIEKVYIATVEGHFDEKNRLKIQNGVEIDGKKTSECEITINKYNDEKNKTIVKLVLHEGMNREVKRMFESVGYNVIKLHREEFAGISSKGLYEGQYRKLSFEEVHNLKKMTKIID